MGDYRTDFDARIGGLGLKYFSPGELLARTSAKNKFGTANSKPPERLWDNIIPTILVLDALREHLGKSISLVSIYRSEAYNQASSDKSTGYTGRAKTSQHMAFSAIDFKVAGMPCTDIEKILMEWSNSGRMFHSPVMFERKAEKVKAGTIPFGELPRTWRVWPLGVWFAFKGYIHAYPSENFCHIDTRGQTSKMSE
ncbi:D-Ala-D-Ala carboxypeptidase family metallohydrolase [Falsiroseomonas sp. HC035]|uniref:D-Ala-D-Ala carboxypeptidase family metallohydrolase n=1 Tax=Falsiroseomonas sp. HC035 TaxID=3390999 RepID=UPI003D314388